MKAPFIIIFGLFILTMGIYLARKSNKVPSLASREVTKKDSPLLYNPLSSKQRQAQTAAANAISIHEVEIFREKTASQEQVRKEVQANPHGAPRSIIKFAETLGPMMEKALSNETDAKTLIAELQVCALNEAADVTIRALCVSHAEKLSAPHPQLKPQSDKIRSSVPSEILQMADARKMKLK